MRDRRAEFQKLIANLADPEQDTVVLQNATAPTNTGLLIENNANDDDLWLNDVMLDAEGNVIVQQPQFVINNMQ